MHYFLTISFFNKSLDFLRSTGTNFKLSTSILFILESKLFRFIGTVFNLSISNSTASDLWLAKSTFFTNGTISIPVMLT